jgi:NTE family protein
MSASGLQIGLALGSGIARGWAHIGVLRALERNGFKPDIVCGTSIGALVGGAYLGGQLDQLEEWATHLNKLRLSRFFDLQLGRGGLIAGGRQIAQIFRPDFRDCLIENLPMRFACVTTEFGTGHEVWLQKGNLLEAVRASYALPGVFPPVRIDGRWLLDGALVNPVPTSLCRALDARIVIAVNLNAAAVGTSTIATESQGGSADEQALASKINGFPGAALVRKCFSRQRDTPTLLNVMASSLNIIQDRLTRSRLAGEPSDVTIAPKIGHIGILQFDRAKESIAAGEEAVEQAIPALKAALRRLTESSQRRFQ